MRKNTNNLRWLWLSLAVIILDQITKFFALHYLTFDQPVSIIPFLNLTLERNPGAAFGLLSQAEGWQIWMFGSIAVLVCTAITYWLHKLPRSKIWLPIALALILGGALGNLCDRIIHGYVIDFLDFYIGNWHWPAFNLADSAISIGAVMLIIDIVWQRQSKASNK
ncbi:MAG: hypothetical protein AMJ43_01525 [Coxiella sp. DG_40]|nr:MAG: hypothetical protein AMJ43_01525 [Coxiella sp. DG_40]